MSTSMPRVAKKIGVYQIGEQIGKGAIGTVYKGINIENASIVAIKQISLENLREEDKKSMKMEINLLKKLKHENIVKYIDAHYTEIHLNIILEYVDSGSLSSIIKKFGSFQESLVAIYIKQVLTGLDYLHSQGVVHRDIKGANILTTKEGLVKLADFGVATRLAEGEKAVSVVGTPYWMAPEIIEMRGHVSTSCDIWSVGCTVIELLTGTPPYYGLPQWSTLFRIVQDDHPPLPNGISENCKDFLLKCFHKDPMLRIDAKGLLKHPWIHNQNTEFLGIINASNNQLPEEVTNTIRLHMDKAGGIPLPLPRVVASNDDLSSEENDIDGSRQTHGNASARPLSPSNTSNILHYENLTGPGEVHHLHRQDLRAYARDPSFLYNQDNTSNIMNMSQTANLDRKYLRTSNIHASYEEGSFVSVDNEGTAHWNIEGVRNSKNRPLAQSTKDLRNLMEAKEDHKIISELNEIIEGLASVQDFTDPTLMEEVIKNMIKIIEILRVFPPAKHHFMLNYGLTGLIDVLEQSEIPVVTHVTLQLINQIIENDPHLQEQSCIFGILPYMIKYTQAEYPRYVRVEAAYYLGQLARGITTLQIFIASGGFKALVELLDLNYEENKDLICLAIDSLIWIFDMNILLTQHLCRILFKLGIFQRLVLLIGNLYTDKDENAHQYLFKALNLMVSFAKCEDSNIRQLMCEDEILLVLQIYLKNFAPTPPILCKVVRIIRFISSEPSILNKLELIGILPIILDLTSKAIANSKSINENEEILIDLTNILFHMCKLNTKRQEQIAMKGGIPLLIHLTQKTTKDIERITLPLLCQFVQTSPITRKKLWENGGPKIFLDYLDDDYYQAKILDTIAFWLGCDQSEIENILIDYHVFTKLIEVFQNANKTTFQQIVPIYLRLIQYSDKFGIKLSNTPEFLKEIVERLDVDLIQNNEKVASGKSSMSKHRNVPSGGKKHVRIECSNPSALVRKELLDILLHLCFRHSNPRQLLNEHNLYLIIMQILHNEDMVILEGKAAQLWQIYSGGSGLPMKYEAH